ncbi:hypothetical protein BT93_L2500 [Corymbia citriodora subsp. variegata]|uniref:Uncharacterized protein n=1 Tax=Corymbia citriodora subsp. variegata TaxID=360336 RepID=A0A8T0CKT9_CORYI|nr:hypothetical protein BT93_L2500 [Corymbia citriodora subsp. variegata]
MCFVHRSIGNWNVELSWLKQTTKGSDFHECLLMLLWSFAFISGEPGTPSCIQSLPLVDAVIQTVRFTVEHCFKGCRDSQSRITLSCMHLKLCSAEKWFGGGAPLYLWMSRSVVSIMQQL